MDRESPTVSKIVVANKLEEDAVEVAVPPIDDMDALSENKKSKP